VEIDARRITRDDDIGLERSESARDDFFAESRDVGVTPERRGAERGKRKARNSRGY